jgi:outer membrane receptor protein involved in Fe transport
MKKHLLNLVSFITAMFCGNVLLAQNLTLTGKIVFNSAQPVMNADLTIKELNVFTETDSTGSFTFSNLKAGSYTLLLKADGFLDAEKKLKLEEKKTFFLFTMSKDYLNLAEVVIESSNKKNENVIGKIDMQLRPVNSSQDLLRMVPGLFIAQHAGGGKAEQIFFRGFDVDHGTDFAIHVDGMPVNMPSHAHGQGYADLHFLIPETVKELEVNKGPYATKYGDLATSGSGEFKTMNYLEKNMVKVEFGAFNTKRIMAMLDLLGNKHIFSKNKENLYIAGEYRYTDSYFLNKQHFQRINFFGKYNGILNNGSQLTITASTFQSSWNASGQIPTRKVSDGSISRFGSIDPTEGGQTSRSNFSIVHTHPFKKAEIKNQLYYSRYDFNLFSNFTFFLYDPVNGDQIQQGDHRNLLGYLNTVTLNGKLGSKKITSTIGTGLRYDNSAIALSHTKKREFLNDIVRGKLNQLNGWTYLNEDIYLTKKIKLNAGARLDIYNFDFKNQTCDTASGKVLKALVSPKLNLIYTVNSFVELYAKSGFGFHSNDARAVVVGSLQNTLARAFGYEAGSTFKPFKKLMVNVAAWSLALQSELVYVGDAGIVEAVGRSQRYGIDFGMRYQIGKYLFFDGDINVNHGRLVDEPFNANHIPLAPTFTSIGGISWKKTTGLNGSLRYRYMGNRAATEDNSIIARGYFLIDATLNYTHKKYQVGITVENLLNRPWNEAQFATESRLQNEPTSVTEIHYTPGTPIFIRGNISVFF